MQPYAPDPNLVHLAPECERGGQTYRSRFRGVLGRRNPAGTWRPVLSPAAPPHGAQQGPAAYHGLADEEQQEGFLDVVLWAVEAARHKRRRGCSTAPRSTAGPPRLPRWPFYPGVRTSPRKVTPSCIIQGHRTPPAAGSRPQNYGLQGCCGRPGWKCCKCFWGRNGPSGAQHYPKRLGQGALLGGHRPHLQLLAQTREMGY